MDKIRAHHVKQNKPYLEMKVSHLFFFFSIVVSIEIEDTKVTGGILERRKRRRGEDKRNNEVDIILVYYRHI